LHIHLVNLDRNPERLAEFCNVNRHLTSVSRFPAVDGNSLQLDSLVREGLVTKDILSMFSVGALGCAMSNITLWDRATANNQMVTVCEDDAIFNVHFEERAEELLQSLPKDWTIIFWGFNFNLFVCFDVLPGVSPCVATFSQEQMRGEVSAFQRQVIAPQAYKARWVFGTSCYSISPWGAKLLKSKILPLRPKTVPLPEAQLVPPYRPKWRTVGIDNCINAIQAEINSFVCFPPLVISKNEREKSTVLNAG
jgi:GR25 family glycosyltransferase involved in LPS biosynthesis